MKLNDLGRIVHDSIAKIPEYCDRAVIHEFIVMPNHIHFIIELKELVAAPVGADIIRPIAPSGATRTLSAAARPTGQIISAPTKSVYKYSKSLGSVIRGFKSGVTQKIGRSVWQRNYYEHIVRDNADYENIRAYISNNPQTWDADKLFQKQLEDFNQKLNNL
jgi:REP element-mobilizing transposase RayT